jgi:parvulin-like peptidyl-prolyl cis-trans isomerase-like protein
VKRKPVLLILFVAGIVAAQSCKSLFKSDYAELKADDLAAFVEAAYPDMQKRQFAENEQLRKQVIDGFKRVFAFAQAAEKEGLHKSDKFERRMELTIEGVLATKYTERNPAVIVSKEEWEAYCASHKDQFDAHVKFINENSKEPITDKQKEQEREMWGQTRVRSDKARQAGLDKDLGVKVLMKFVRANILASLYTRSLEEKHKLTDDEKKKYLAENPGADPDKLKEKAQGLLERVKKGESFEKIAGEFSDDPGSKANGGDLGWFGKGMMDPAFEAAAFALQKGQTSNELVKSRFGYHIIRVEDRRTGPPKAAASPAPPGPGQTPELSQGPKEEVHARHILIDTTESDRFESRLIQDKVKRDQEDATLKFAVVAPTDFVVNVAGLERNPIPGVGGGQGGSMREIKPGENK